MAFPGPKVCGGGWAEQYASRHRQIRAGKLPPRYLTFIQYYGGLGAQLNGLVSSFLAALLTNRALVMESDSMWIFDSGEVDLRMGPDVPVKIKNRCFRDGCRGLEIIEDAGTPLASPLCGDTQCGVHTVLYGLGFICQCTGSSHFRAKGKAQLRRTHVCWEPTSTVLSMKKHGSLLLPTGSASC